MEVGRLVRRRPFSGLEIMMPRIPVVTAEVEGSVIQMTCTRWSQQDVGTDLDVEREKEGEVKCQPQVSDF